jgi:tRNA(Ile)-lysidine synthase
MDRRVLDRVRQAVRLHRLWQPGQRVLLACSGGADSMGGLELLRRLRRSLGHQLAVAHVDHGLWPGSGAAAEQVAQHARELGLPVAVRRLALAPGAELEARARTARYTALAEMAQALDCAVVATAHHADDQAETLLLRLARGAGRDALVGIRRRRGDGVVRPLLDLSRDQLRAWAPAARIVDDPSNADVHFARNAVRHAVLPALAEVLPGAIAGLARTAAALAEHDGQLARWRDRTLATRWRDGSLDLAGLPLDAADAPEVLRFLAERAGRQAPSQRAMAQFAQLLGQRRGHADFRGFQVRKDGARLQVVASEVARPRGADYLAQDGQCPPQDCAGAASRPSRE